MRKAMLKEGKSYDFEIRKLIKLSDEQNYFILIGPYGKKYLMFDSYYLGYGMKSGDTINCKVNKINCNGKIFLEPAHPYYKIGQEYEFEFTAIKEIENSKKVKQCILFVNDPYKSTAFIPGIEKSVYKKYLSGKVIAKVENIKKARLYLKVDVE